MKDLRRAGGYAGLVAAGTVVVGLGMFATLLTDYTTGDPTPGESVAFLADNEATIFVWNAVTLLVFSVALVPFALALYEWLKPSSPVLAATGTVFAFIWAGLLLASGMILNVASGTIVELQRTDPAQAETLWLSVDTVANGMSGGMEIVGSTWVLLISLASLRAGLLPKALGYLGIVMAVTGLTTIVPALEMVGAVFGLGLIVWFAWYGTLMIRQPAAAAATSVPADRSAAPVDETRRSDAG
ncbi:MAG: DUF4386 family protein [Acidimicrobiales bacterium]